VLLLTLLACDGEKAIGPFALAFDGAEDCVEVDTASTAVPAALTVEVWLRGDPGHADALRPFVNWTGLFSLDEDREGNVYFTVGAGPGASSGASVMDGVLHHLAGTWDGESTDLFVDGVREGFAAGAPTEPPGDTIRFGCDSAANAYPGLLDEVRISSVVRYTDDFSVPTAAYEPDADTLGLFHVDEGEGDTTMDAAAGLVGQVEGADWVPFSLSDGS
jgi:hypothetical protein